MARKGEKTKESLINCEIKRLNKIFGLKGEETKGFQQELIQNAAFMAVSLRELQKIINECGYSDEYQNGKDQSGTKKTPEVDIYNTMIKNFNTTMKQLYEMMPESGKKGSGETEDPLLGYISGRGRS